MCNMYYKQLSDYKPVSLTSFVMKTMEKLVKSLIVPIIESQLNPLQLACRAGGGVEEAKVIHSGPSIYTP